MDSVTGTRLAMTGKLLFVVVLGLELNQMAQLT